MSNNKFEIPIRTGRKSGSKEQFSTKSTRYNGTRKCAYFSEANST